MIRSPILKPGKPESANHEHHVSKRLLELPVVWRGTPAKLKPLGMHAAAILRTPVVRQRLGRPSQLSHRLRCLKKGLRCVRILKCDQIAIANPWGRTVPTHKGGIAHEAEGIATDDGPQPPSVLLSPECLAPGGGNVGSPGTATRCGTAPHLDAAGRGSGSAKANGMGSSVLTPHCC